MVRSANRRGWIQFFEDDQGRLSITRLTFFLSSVGSLFIAIWYAINKNPDDAIGLVAAISGISSVDKLGKNYFEQQEKALPSAIASENAE